VKKKNPRGTFILLKVAFSEQTLEKHKLLDGFPNSAAV
jgi:hypothetical protein